MRRCIRGWPANGTLGAIGRQRIGGPYIGSLTTLLRAGRICPTQYIRTANLVNRIPVFPHVIMCSTPQCHHHDDGGCGGQPHVGQHAKSPPPQFSSRIPGSQSTRIIPHAGDNTGTMFQENQVKRFVTVLVGPAVGILNGRRQSGPGFRRHVLLVQPGSGGVRIISDDIPRHEAADRFLNVLNHALTLRAGNSSRQSGLYSFLEPGPLAFGQTGYSFYVE